MFPPVDTKNASAVAAFVKAAFGRIFPSGTLAMLDPLFTEVPRLFEGRHPDYGAIDLRYHDLEHTLQATVCLVLLLEGRHAAGAEPRLTARQFELSVAAALLHDSGYLKLRADTSGTGAKYTYCHVLRSCAFAASYLPSLGANDRELELVLGAINCTGPAKEINRLYFRETIDRVIGCALATSDYLAQMAAVDYPDELEILFNEFKESDDYIHLPPDRRIFSSAAQLIERTPAFWSKVVLPKLEHDFEGVYRFLAQPHPHGRNLYVEAVERNIATIQNRALPRPETAAVS
jgi:hypothetical protein